MQYNQHVKQMGNCMQFFTIVHGFKGVRHRFVSVNYVPVELFLETVYPKYAPKSNFRFPDLLIGSD